MKKNNIVKLMICLIILCLSIGAVSAADTDNQTVLTEDNANSFTDLNTEISTVSSGTNIDLNQNYTYDVDKDSDYDKDKGIEINKDLTIKGADGADITIDAKNQSKIFVINEGATVTFDSITFINANGQNGGAISNFGTLILKNCTFINNTATYRGAAVYNEKGTVNVDNTLFDGNDITYRSRNADNGGAAVFNKQGTITLTNSNITNNVKDYVVRQSDENGKIYGDLVNGVITSLGGNAAVDNCKFINNGACYGGVIYSGGDYDSYPYVLDNSLVVKNSEFINNTGYTGGAIQIYQGLIEITNSTFDGNYAGVTNGSKGYSATAGAVCAMDYKEGSFIKDSTFVNNYGYQAGAVCINSDYDILFNIENTIFVNNSAGTVGGAVLIKSQYSDETGPNVNILNSTFENNSAPMGGAILNDIINTVNIADSKFVNNAAVTRGGAVYNEKGTVNVDNTLFDGNDVTFRSRNADNGGAAVFNKQGTITLTNSNITNNLKDYALRQPDKDGKYYGDIINSVVTNIGGNATVDNCKFVNNSGCYGGAIYSGPDTDNSSDRVLDNSLTVVNSEFINNTAYMGAGIDADKYTLLKVTNSTFDGNYAGVTNGSKGYGASAGAIIAKIYKEGSFIKDSTFVNNYGYQAGAVCINNDENITFDIENSKFANNTAGTVGGAVLIKSQYSDETGPNVNILNSTFENNSAPMGGAILNEIINTVNIADSKFVNNTAVTRGGAVYNFQGTVNVDNTLFDGNDVTFRSRNADNGGAAVFNKQGNVNLTNSNVTNNLKDYVVRQPDENGKIYGDLVNGVITSIGGNASIDNCKFVNNSGCYGGAIYSGPDTDNSSDRVLDNSLTVVNSEFINNTAYMGGGIDADSYTLLKVTNSTFDGNYAGVTNGSKGYSATGGAICAKNYENGSFIEDSTFVNNYGYQAGAVSVSSDNENSFTINNDTFINNTAGYAGGALLVTYEYVNTSSPDVTVSNSTFKDNKAPHGGAISTDTIKTVTVSNDTIFENNTPYDLGGFNSLIDVKIINNGYGKPIEVIVNLTGLNGIGLNKTVKLNVNNKEYFVDTTDGIGTINLTDLDRGNYNVIASFEGDINYKSSNDTNSFELAKGDITSITIANSTYGDNHIVLSVLDKNATGKVTLTIGKITYGAFIENGTINIPTNLNVGDYTVSVSYTDDVNYNDAVKDVSFTVFKANPSLVVVAGDVTYPGDAVVFVDVVGLNNVGLDGSVTVSVNGKDYVVSLVGGKGNVTVAGLGAGDYAVTASFDGNGNYNASENSTSFTVGKADISSIVISNVTYGNDIGVSVLPADANGKVSFTVDGTIYTGNVVNGVAVVPAGLGAGDYTVSVSYTDDVNYNDAVKDVSFTVSKANPNLIVSAGDVTYPGDAVVFVDVVGLNNVGLDGSVTVSVNGKDYVVSLVGGKGNVTVAGLGAGDYAVTASFDGNGNYNASENSTSFTVGKADISSIVISNVTYGNDISVSVLPADANGKVSFTVDGTIYTADVVNGVAVIPAGLGAGDYTVSVSYTDDVNYNDAVKDVSFTVSKVASNLVVVAGDVTYPGDAVVFVDVVGLNNVGLDGSVTVSVNGKDYVVSLVGGKGNVTVAGLGAGDYAVTASFDGNGNYNASENSTSFTVGKADISSIVISNVTYGNDISVSVLPADANGKVSFTVDGTTYTGNVVNGSAVITLPNAGIYNVNVTYTNDNNYNDFTDEINFTIFKQSNLTVLVNNTEYGKEVNIIINFTDVNGTGLNKTVAVNVNGIDYNISTVDGIGSLTVNDLAIADDYQVISTFAGDNEYTSNTANALFNVSKISNNLTFNYDDKGNIYVKLVDSNGNPLSNATLIYTVNGVEQPELITDENGSVVLNNLAAGEQTVNVTYLGNETYKEYSIEKSVVVVLKELKDTKILADDFNQTAVDFYNGERGGYFRITLVDSDGNPLANKNISIGFNGVIYNKTTNASGMAELQINLKFAGTYTFATVFLSDGEEYKGCFAVNTITITKKPTSLTLTGNTPAKVNTYKTLTINLKGQNATDRTKYVNAAGKKVTVTVNGKTYTGKTNENGTATVRIKISKAGTYTVTTKFAGDGTFAAKTVTSKITVRR